MTISFTHAGIDQDKRYVRQPKTIQAETALIVNSTYHGELPKNLVIIKDHIEIIMAIIVVFEILEICAADALTHRIS